MRKTKLKCPLCKKPLYYFPENDFWKCISEECVLYDKELSYKQTTRWGV